MADIYWPSNVPGPERAPENIENSAIRSSMESGTVVTRPRFTRMRTTWKLSWNVLHNTHYQIIRNFYLKTVVGGSLPFLWAHPLDNKTYTVRFLGNLEADPFSDVFWSVNLTLEEV